MAKDEQPQIYLVSPPHLELSRFATDLAEILDACPIACFRLALASTDEHEIQQAADQLREICHARDVAIVIDEHYRLVERLGLDGCHLRDGARNVRDVRKELGSDAIVGAECGASRHVGMSAADSGADYVWFGPVAASALGTDEIAERALFEWWSEMIEVPVVASGGLTNALVGSLSEVTDFFGIGTEIWTSEEPIAALNALMNTKSN